MMSLLLDATPSLTLLEADQHITPSQNVQSVGSRTDRPSDRIEIVRKSVATAKRTGDKAFLIRAKDGSSLAFRPNSSLPRTVYSRGQGRGRGRDSIRGRGASSGRGRPACAQLGTNTLRYSTPTRGARPSARGRNLSHHPVTPTRGVAIPSSVRCPLPHPTYLPAHQVSRSASPISNRSLTPDEDETPPSSNSISVVVKLDEEVDGLIVSTDEELAALFPVPVQVFLETPERERAVGTSRANSERSLVPA